MMERRDDKQALISAEAADWLIRLRDDDLAAAERRRYLAWLKQSPNHIAEMLRLSGLSGWLSDAKLDGFVADQETSNVIEFVLREPIEPVQPRSRWRPRKVAATFAGLALAVLVGLVAKVAWFDQTIETQAGEWRHFTLSDGSIVRVGPHSQLRIEFDDTHRSVHLSRGEAVFQVAKDPARPFFVNAELAVVRAVGTQFGVTRHDENVVVTVAEGKVAVSQGDRQVMPQNDLTSASVADEASVPVSAGEQVAVSRAKPVIVRQVDTTRVLAWAQGRLIFDNTTTVAQAIDEFNRRNRIQIVVDDAAIAASRVCCVFNVDDPESFAQSVATKSDVDLVREGDVLHLVRAVGDGAT